MFVCFFCLFVQYSTVQYCTMSVCLFIVVVRVRLGAGHSKIEGIYYYYFHFSTDRRRIRAKLGPDRSAIPGVYYYFFTFTTSGRQKFRIQGAHGKKIVLAVGPGVCLSYSVSRGVKRLVLKVGIFYFRII